jgi:hypothetical protein
MVKVGTFWIGLTGASTFFSRNCLASNIVTGKITIPEPFNTTLAVIPIFPPLYSKDMLIENK